MKRTVWAIALSLLGSLAAAVLLNGCFARSPGYAPQGYSARSAMDPGAGRAEGAVASGPEELWVIERAETPPADGPAPGTGSLMAKKPGEDQTVPVPLKHTDVKAAIAGAIATVDVTQQYHNPYDTKIEATYLFPLPHNAAIREFVMTIGERHIRGIIREREEARRIYDEARGQGYVASLMTQERPNIFTQSVANIEPGKQIDISIRYFHTLAYDDGWFEFVFPMVVGPRFNPPGTTQGVGAVGRGGTGDSGQSTEVQYLRPGERSGHDIGLSVSIDAGMAIEKVETPNHTVVSTIDAGRASVKLAESDAIANKDFVLRYKLAGAGIKSGLIAHADEKGGHFVLMIVPPADMRSLARQPLEMVFTLDVSGSMSGRPIDQSRAAMNYALGHMRPEDSFQVVKFADGTERFSDKPVPATEENVKAGLKYISALRGGGGTMMLDGIRDSLDFPHDEGRLRFVCFLTDGYIGNESEILGQVHKSLGPSRIFSFGVGSSPNRFLLEHMAKLGRGAVAYLSLNDNAETVMARFFERISHPAMTDVTIDWGGLQVSEVYPKCAPDLFVGRPVIMTGKFAAAGKGTIRISGRAGGRTQSIDVPVDLSATAPRREAIASLWARMKIADLCDRACYEDNPALPGSVKDLSLNYGLLSPYTAFVAVDSTRRTDGDHGVSVPVAVPVPDGVKYETTVQEK